MSLHHFLLESLSLLAILSGILVIISRNPVISVLFLISVFVNVAGYLVLLGVGFIGISYLIVYVGAIAILFLFVVIMLNLQLAELSSGVSSGVDAPSKEYTQNLPLGLVIGSLFLFELLSLLPFTYKDLGSLPGTDTGTLSSSTGLPYHQPTLQQIIGETELGLFHWLHQFFMTTTRDISTTGIHSIFSTLPTSADTTFSNFLQIQAIGQSLYTTGSLWLILASVILLLAMVGPIILTLNNNTN